MGHLTAADAEQVDLLENGTGPSGGGQDRAPWRRSAGSRGASLVVVLLRGRAGSPLAPRPGGRPRARAARRPGHLPGAGARRRPRRAGRCRYFVVVRNEGPRPVSVTVGSAAAADGLRLRMRDDVDAADGPVGGELSIPLSIRLTCADAGAGTALTAELAVRRAGRRSRPPARCDLEPAALVLDVAATLCAVRPDLRDHELSGPVLRGVAATGDTGG